MQFVMINEAVGYGGFCVRHVCNLFVGQNGAVFTDFGSVKFRFRWIYLPIKLGRSLALPFV